VASKFTSAPSSGRSVLSAAICSRLSTLLSSNPKSTRYEAADFEPFEIVELLGGVVLANALRQPSM